MRSAGGAQVGTETRHRTSYTLSLLRADTQVKFEGNDVTMPHHALELPFDGEQDAATMEHHARRLRSAGGWPAWRRDYAMASAPGADGIARLQPGVESEIELR